jgi:hypothetical protein
MYQTVLPKIIAVLMLLSACSRADSARFLRILNLYNDPTYHASDRKSFVSFDYHSNSNDSKPEERGLSSDYDRLQYFERYVAHDLGVKGVLYKGDSMKTRGYTLRAGLSGTYQCTSSVRSNAMINEEDIFKLFSLSENVYIFLSRESNDYFRLFNSKKWFWALSAQSHGMFGGNYSRLYRDFNLTGNEFVLNNTKVIDLYEAVFLAPGFGWGKPTFVTPVYRAFEIERALQESGIISGQLSDDTMVRIAYWLAAEFSVFATRDRPQKHFYAGLDTIISKDSSVNPSLLSAYAAMNIEEKHNNTFPLLWNGFKASISGHGTLRAAYENLERRMNDSLVLPSGPGFNLEETYRLFVTEIQWGKALSSHFFYALGAATQPMGDSEDDFFAFTDNDDFITLNGSLYYLVNDRIYFDLGVEDLPLKFRLPLQQPGRVRLSGHYFIEDHISLVLSLVHEYLEYESNYVNGYYGTVARVNKGITDKINLGFYYDF